MIEPGFNKYRIGIKNITPSVGFKTNLRPRRCFIGVSWENPNFNHKYLPSIFKWVEENFDHCSVIIADYLYRHSLQIKKDISEADAIEMALSQGLTTYNEYKQFLNGNKKFKVYRWQNEEISVNHDYIESFVQKLSINILSDIDLDSRVYVNRKETTEQSNSSLSFEEKLELSRKYIIEEMAFINRQAEVEIKCSVYPGTQLTVLKNFALNKYSGVNLPLQNVVYLDLQIKK